METWTVAVYLRKEKGKKCMEHIHNIEENLRSIVAHQIPNHKF